MAQPPSIRNFVNSLLSSWSVAMSVPLAVAAFFVSNGTAKVLLAVTAFACVWAASYVLWSRERTERNRSEDKARDAERKLEGSLKFAREIRIEEDGGHYFAYATARNISLASKLTNCRCEIAELRDASGKIIQRNIGLKIRAEHERVVGGRFNLDQGSEKDVPLFELDQLQNAAFYLISAEANKRKLDFGVYTARLRGYGDSGKPDEITVMVDCRASPFCIVT